LVNVAIQEENPNVIDVVDQKCAGDVEKRLQVFGRRDFEFYRKLQREGLSFVRSYKNHGVVIVDTFHSFHS